MIYDCFTFFNELDLLEIRLNSMAPYVDRFVLCESPVTYSGKPKPLYFADNKSRYSAFPITHIIAHDYHLPLAGGPWQLENHQRERIMWGLKDAHEDDLIIFSDLDEIPNLTRYLRGPRREGVFRHKLYYYYCNAFTGRRNWHGTIAVYRRNLTSTNCMNTLRDLRNKLPVVAFHGGWHFSTLGSVENIQYKIESYAHVEFDTDKVKGNIASNRENLLDPYNRTEDQLRIEMPSGPQWLLDNASRYPHLWL